MARQFVIMESSGSANSMCAPHFEPVGQQRRYWLDYDPVALAVLVIGIGLIEVLACLRLGRVIQAFAPIERK